MSKRKVYPDKILAIEKRDVDHTFPLTLFIFSSTVRLCQYFVMTFVSLVTLTNNLCFVFGSLEIKVFSSSLNCMFYQIC